MIDLGLRQAYLLAAAFLPGIVVSLSAYLVSGDLSTAAVTFASSSACAGFIAWLIWMFVHLMSIVGVKNRLLIFVNWAWNYFTYDQSLRLLIKPSSKPSKSEQHE